MNRWQQLFLSLALAILATLSVGLESGLAEGTTPTATTVKLAASPRMDDNGNPLKGQLILAATVTTRDGKAVNGRTVSFFENVDLLGPKQALLGTATTDSTGVGAIAYQPSQTGHQTIVAQLPDGAGYASAETQMDLEVSEVDPPFKPEPKPLASIGDGMAIAFGVASAGTWIVLLGVLLRTVIGIRSVGRLSSARSEAASDGAIQLVEPRS